MFYLMFILEAAVCDTVLVCGVILRGVSNILSNLIDMNGMFVAGTKHQQ